MEKNLVGRDNFERSGKKLEMSGKKFQKKILASGGGRDFALPKIFVAPQMPPKRPGTVTVYITTSKQQEDSTCKIVIQNVL